jgi:hypothetical protein
MVEHIATFEKDSFFKVSEDWWVSALENSRGGWADIPALTRHKFPPHIVEKRGKQKKNDPCQQRTNCRKGSSLLFVLKLFELIDIRSWIKSRTSNFQSSSCIALCFACSSAR